MKFLIIASIMFLGFSVKAQNCESLFQSSPLEKTLNHFQPKPTNGADIMLTLFGGIFNAPNKSHIKVFTKNLQYDGISALLLMSTISESFKARGLKFDFYLEDNFQATRLHDLFTENSKNKIRFLNRGEQPFTGQTLIVIDSPGQTTYIQFVGDLNSRSLKDQSAKSAIKVNYGGSNMLMASPFHKNIPSSVVKQESSVVTDLKQDVWDAAFSYTEKHPPKLKAMNDQDIQLINMRAYDLALQLYVYKYGKSPKELLDALQIIKATVMVN